MAHKVTQSFFTKLHKVSIHKIGVRLLINYNYSNNYQYQKLWFYEYSIGNLKIKINIVNFELLMVYKCGIIT